MVNITSKTGADLLWMMSTTQVNELLAEILDQYGPGDKAHELLSELIPLLKEDFLEE